MLPEVLHRVKVDSSQLPQWVSLNAEFLVVLLSCCLFLYDEGWKAKGVSCCKHTCGATALPAAGERPQCPQPQCPQPQLMEVQVLHIKAELIRKTSPCLAAKAGTAGGVFRGCLSRKGESWGFSASGCFTSAFPAAQKL